MGAVHSDGVGAQADHGPLCEVLRSANPSLGRDEERRRRQPHDPGPGAGAHTGPPQACRESARPYDRPSCVQRLRDGTRRKGGAENGAQAGHRYRRRARHLAGDRHPARRHPARHAAGRRNRVRADGRESCERPVGRQGHVPGSGDGQTPLPRRQQRSGPAHHVQGTLGDLPPGAVGQGQRRGPLPASGGTVRRQRDRPRRAGHEAGRHGRALRPAHGARRRQGAGGPPVQHVGRDAMPHRRASQDIPGGDARGTRRRRPDGRRHGQPARPQAAVQGLRRTPGRSRGAALDHPGAVGGNGPKPEGLGGARRCHGPQPGGRPQR